MFLALVQPKIKVVKSLNLRYARKSYARVPSLNSNFSFNLNVQSKI